MYIIKNEISHTNMVGSPIDIIMSLNIFDQLILFDQLVNKNSLSETVFYPVSFYRITLTKVITGQS